MSEKLLAVIELLHFNSHDMRGAISERQVERIGHISQSMVEEQMVQLLQTSKGFLSCITVEKDSMKYMQHLVTVYEALKAEIDEAKAYSVSPQVDCVSITLCMLIQRNFQHAVIILRHEAFFVSMTLYLSSCNQV